MQGQQITLKIKLLYKHCKHNDRFERTAETKYQRSQC